VSPHSEDCQNICRYFCSASESKVTAQLSDMGSPMRVSTASAYRVGGRQRSSGSAVQNVRWTQTRLTQFGVC